VPLAKSAKVVKESGAKIDRAHEVSLMSEPVVVEVFSDYV
jgi:hypothetical protein